MARTKSVKTAVKVKTSRKDFADAASASVPVKGHSEGIKAEASIKQPAGAICAVMSLPPPTGQPPKPPGKSPRIADRAASRYKFTKKRGAGQVA